MGNTTILSVNDLCVSFETDSAHRTTALDHVSFDVPSGSTLGLVGESGCGKSLTSLSILRLVPEPPGQIDQGTILFQDRDLLRLSEREMQEIRGAQIAMVFQEPMTSLNPVYRVGSQISEAIRLHQKVSRKAARTSAIELLRLVGIPDPAIRVDAYPHELSGGMRQRVMIAMALSCKPTLLIADEPTTALDVTVQAQILELLQQLQHDLGLSILLITHDLGVIAQVAHHMVVMYAGQVVETGPVREVFASPKHPYTLGLLRSIPPMGASRTGVDQGKPRPKRLPTIEGVVPNLTQLPPGCRFAPRCSYAQEQCSASAPTLRSLSPVRQSRCHFAEEFAA
jgi:oligopeptide/dipeptide ABC transporter ATP-binding protein